MILETTLQTILLPPNLLAELNRSGWSFLLTEFGFPRLMTMEARTVWVPRTRLWTRLVMCWSRRLVMSTGIHPLRAVPIARKMHR